MAVLYFGRFDLLGSEEESLKLFLQFVEYSVSDYTIVTREDKEKDDVTPTKVHFHFLISSTKKHDTLRGKMTKMGWIGSLASLSIAVAPPKRTLEKSHHYVLKQQNVVFTSLTSDEIDKLKELSKNYNEEVLLKPSFQHHFIEFILPELQKRNYSFRGDILIYIIGYVTNYNQNVKGARMNLPTNNEMLKCIQYYEMKQFPNDSVYSLINDYRGVFGFMETSKSIHEKELNEIRERRKHDRERFKTASAFVDSEEEESIKIVLKMCEDCGKTEAGYSANSMSVCERCYDGYNNM